MFVEVVMKLEPLFLTTLSCFGRFFTKSVFDHFASNHIFPHQNDLGSSVFSWFWCNYLCYFTGNSFYHDNRSILKTISISLVSHGSIIMNSVNLFTFYILVLSVCIEFVFVYTICLYNV